MLPPGHIATAYLVALATRREHARAWHGRHLSFGWTIVGAVVPDVVDKGLFVLGLVGNSRHVGHSAFVWLFAVLALWCASRWKRESPMVDEPGSSPRFMALSSITAGGVSHMATDFLTDPERALMYGGCGIGPWWVWPARPDYETSICIMGPIESGRGFSSLELAVIMAAVFFLASGWLQREET